MQAKCRSAIYGEVIPPREYHYLDQICGIIGFPEAEVMWGSVKSGWNHTGGVAWNRLWEGFAKEEGDVSGPVD